MSRHYLDRVLAKGNPYLEALYPFYEAGFYFDSDPARSEAAYLRSDSSLAPFTTKESYFFRAKAWRNYGALRQRDHDHMGFTEALLHKAIPLTRQAGDSTYEGICYLDLGLLLMNDLQYEKAGYYYQQSITFLRNTGSKYTALVTSYLLACRNAVFAKRYDSAKRMLDKAKAILAPYPENSSFLDLYLAQGIYYGKTGQFSTAEKSLDKGMALAARLHDDYGLQEQVFQKYKLHKEQKKYAEGIALLRTLLMNEKIIMGNGAKGYLLKNASPDELIRCIHSAMAGKPAFSREVSEIINRPGKNEHQGIPQLTKREKQILHMLAEGKTSVAIARELFLSPLTVDRTGAT